MQKIFYLPEAHTDFILAVIGEELGVAGVCGLLFLYGMIAYAGPARPRSARRALYAKLLAAGLTSLILCQATLNVFAVLGLAPLTGVPLPFISYGLEQPDRAARRDGAAAQHRRGGARAAAAVRWQDRDARWRRRIVIAAGGTAGHVVPALAVADALRAEGAEVVFVGGERAEAELVPGGRLRAAHRSPSRGSTARNPLKAARGGAARPRARSAPRARMLRDVRPDAVLGGGGYVAGPVGLAAALRAIPLVLTEADRHLGLTNRLLARFARRVCLAFPIEGARATRYLRHGPAGAAAGRPTARGPRAVRARPRTTRCVLVFGGSLGARSINEAAIEAFAGRAFRVLHVCGRARLRDAARPRAAGAALRPARVHRRRSATRSRRRPRRGARRRLDLRDRRARAPGGARPVSARRRPTTRPPTRAGWPRRRGGRASPTPS